MLVIEKKERKFSKLIQFWTIFCIFSKMRRALHLLDFMFVNIAGVKKWQKKMFLPFLLNLIEKKSTQKNKYNVVRNKNSQKSDCVVHYML